MAPGKKTDTEYARRSDAEQVRVNDEESDNLRNKPGEILGILWLELSAFIKVT